MDAVYSGQAATLAFLEGADVRVFRADVEASITIAREGLSYLFLGCSDVTYARGVDERVAKQKFVEAWKSDRALRLLLIALDAEEEDEDLRREAADNLEQLAELQATRTFIENELFSRALPTPNFCFQTIGRAQERSCPQFWIDNLKFEIAARRGTVYQKLSLRSKAKSPSKS
jgi:hypothetical protein